MKMRKKEFDDRNTKIVLMSCDPIHVQMEWSHDILCMCKTALHEKTAKEGAKTQQILKETNLQARGFREFSKNTNWHQVLRTVSIKKKNYVMSVY